MVMESRLGAATVSGVGRRKCGLLGWEGTREGGKVDRRRAHHRPRNREIMIKRMYRNVKFLLTRSAGNGMEEEGEWEGGRLAVCVCVYVC